MFRAMKFYPAMQPCLFLLLIIFVPSPTESVPLWSTVCQADHPAVDLPFCNSQLTLGERVDDYVKRIPTENQIDMMSHGAKGYPPLGIPPYQWWSEGLHGPLEPCVEFKGQTKCPTSFPCPSGLGNTFNRTLFYQIGSVIGTEGKAISQLRPHDTKGGDGLAYWSPNVNLQRDPRWGRNQEAPGEDPLLTSVYARNFIHGLQNFSASKDDDSVGDGPLRVAACCKHFIANSLENWYGHTRHNFDAKISEEDLHDYYYRPFQECVQARAAGVMCSYNALNGSPTCLSEKLINQTLRQTWGFDGYLVTDCGALADTINGHKVAKDEEEASAMAIAATVDLNCGQTYEKGLLQAYRDGLASKSDIESSFRRLAKIQFRLGLFDGKKYEPERDIELVGSHGKLAMEAALQSITLLTNQNKTLPMSTDQKVVMIGPHVFGREVFLSNYHGDACGRKSYECIKSPVEAFSNISKQPVEAVMGCKVADTDLNEINKAVNLAKKSDAVVLMVGLDGIQEAEGRDRTETILPGLQRQLVRSVLDVAAEKTIIVLVHGGAMSLGGDTIKRSGAILSASYGGQEAAGALAHVIFGLYNPSGKLSSTMYPSTFVDEIPMTEMGLDVGVGRTHMFYKGKPEFAFGHGLSYSAWNLSPVSHRGSNLTPPDVLIDEKFHPSKTVEINVTNMGPMKGSQTVLLFVQRPLYSRMKQKLIGFQGTSMLDVGESQVLVFQIEHADFETWDTASGSSTAHTGTYQIIARAANTSLSISAYVSDGDGIIVNSQTE